MGSRAAQEYLAITPNDVLISAYHQQDQADVDPAPLDAITLNFAEIGVVYKAQNPDGSVGGPVRAG
jgi:type VI protein secretion system component Hcp